MGGILIIDGAQSMLVIYLFCVRRFDALCFPTKCTPQVLVLLWQKQLINSLELSFVGGGMVEKLDENSFSIPQNDLACKLEPGLQDFAGIIGLGAVIDWLKTYKSEEFRATRKKLTHILFEGIASLKGVHLLNNKPSAIISFYLQDIDAHRLAAFLSQQNIMARSGYFCCHYYLQNVKNYPPLLRISLGLHNTEKDVKKFLEVLKKIINNIQ